MEINNIITKIDENQLFVPAFQREYVWKKKDAKNLIQSLLKGYPTGTMLTWETNNPPELKGNHEYHSNQGSVKLILDGQQRITTLYMLIKGEIPPYYTEKEITHDIRNMYVNVETLELEYFKKILMENNPIWINLTHLLKGEIRTRTVTDKLEELNNNERLPRDKENLIDDNIRKLEKIKERDFLEQEVPAHADIKQAIDIFYIVNSSGVNLTDAELALAQISGYWPQARQLFKTKLSDLKERGWVFKLDFIVYALLAVTHKMGSKMEKLHTSDNKEKIQEAWKVLDENVLDYTCNLLQSQAYVDHTDEINSVYALIPIIAYIYSKPSYRLNEDEIKKVVKWFYYSQIRSRYISQLPQKLDKDLKIVFENDSPFDALLAIIEEERSLEIKPSEFVGRDIRHPLFGLMKWYFKSKGAICFGTGLNIRRNMGKKYDLQKDHIFAYSVLRDSEHFDMRNRFDYAHAQEITNRAILTATENRSKSASFADVYLNEVKERFPNALPLQSIPENEELWKIENFEKFLKVRRELLAEQLNHYLNNISITAERVETEVDLMEIIQGGETHNLEFKSTLRWNIREQKPDKRKEDVIMKSIAAFSNADGGKLLIGVSDDGEIIGLEDDFNCLNGDKDSFELHLKNLVNTNFGVEFGARNISVNFPQFDDLEICEIDVKAGNRPVYCNMTDKRGIKHRKFYARSGNSSQELGIDEIASYVSNRFDIVG